MKSLILDSEMGWEAAMILYYHRSIIVDTRIARETNRLGGEVATLVEERDSEEGYGQDATVENLRKGDRAKGLEERALYPKAEGSGAILILLSKGCMFVLLIVCGKADRIGWEMDLEHMSFASDVSNLSQYLPSELGFPGSIYDQTTS
ncbi:hypothetical protein Tco_0848450 [Tanacetum coccineum]